MAKSKKPIRKKKFSWWMFVGGFLLLYFVLINIIASQSISPFYFGLARGDWQSAAEFLKRIQTSPLFPEELANLSLQFGSGMKGVVFADEAKRTLEIKRLEAELVKNPSSRDILYNLALLYQQQGNSVKAQAYLERARHIDPETR